ncbi:WG repeat-containing protein [Flavobacterium sp.]|uniref:WG repeat-containing protein n=1 Tax=Flavobacterium sp. TaxID=239 RepID=UPI0026306A26|nr:WG repeat-containing protein [Flavobacterium sp.]
MKKSIFILLFFLTFNSFSQVVNSNYKKVYEFDVYRKDWALVKTVANTFGFINKENKEIVPAIYSKIYSFEKKGNNSEYALVKNVAGTYGFINENGKEVIKAIYWKKEEAIQQLNIFLNEL